MFSEKGGKVIIRLVLLQLLVFIIPPNGSSLAPKHIPVFLTSTSNNGAHFLPLSSEFSKAMSWFLQRSIVWAWKLHTADCKQCCLDFYWNDKSWLTSHFEELDLPSPTILLLKGQTGKMLFLFSYALIYPFLEYCTAISTQIFSG